MQVTDAEGPYLQLLQCFLGLKLVTWAAVHQPRGHLQMHGILGRRAVTSCSIKLR